ncbi:MAG: hypothetical protein R6V83_08415 [Candidatus Thorarchaeota archaeon]
MSASSDQRSTQPSRKGDTITEKEEDKKESQIESILDLLRENEHVAKAYPEKGLVVGVRFDRIPNTRSVHVSLTNILDLNSCDLPKMGMQKTVLKAADRELNEVFEDLELDEKLESKCIMTPFGKIEFDVLQSSSSPEKHSLVRQSRMNYVVTSETVDKNSYSWFCEPKRVLNLQDFSLSRRSDAMGTAPDIRAAMIPEKWESLEKGITNGWFAFLAILVGLVGVVSAVYSSLVGGIGWIISVVLAAFSVGFAMWTGLKARKNIFCFKDKLAEEEGKLAEIGDRALTQQQLCKKADIFKKIEDINFVISPLVSRVVDAIENAKIEEAAEASSIIIEKCAKNSSTKRASIPDDGLATFLGLFEELEAGLSESDFDELAISYAGLGAYPSEDRDSLIDYIGTLYRAVSRAGLIDNNLLQRIYDSINLLGTAAFLKQEIESEIPDEIPEPDKCNDGLYQRIGSAGISESGDEVEGNTDSSKDELELTGRQIADSKLKGSPLESKPSEDEEDSL